jgi:hypothetical protein
MAPAPDEPKAAREWYVEFRALRAEHAERLWQLARDALDSGRLDLAYQWAHEVLHQDPDHEAARKFLGHRRQGGAWAKTASRLAVRRERQRHPRLGWPPRQYWTIDSQHFQVITNDSRQAGIELAEHLEELHTVWRQLFVGFWASQSELARAWDQSRPAPFPTRPKHVVVLFGNRQQYVKHLEAAEPLIGISQGYYFAPERLAYFYSGADELVATWRHEATHQLFQEILDADDGVGLHANFWVVEGIALYMQSLERYGDYCTLGGIDAERLQDARYRALNEEFYVPLGQVVSMGREAIQEDERIGRLYSQFAGMTHLLMHYDHQRYRSVLIDYLRAVYAGADHAGTLAQLSGEATSSFDAMYHDFLQVSDEDLAHLSDRLELSKLSLGHTSVSDAGLAHLAQLPNLQWLDLSHCNVTDKGISHLRSAVKLRDLSLERTKISNAALDTVRNFRELEKLDLAYTAITDEGLAPLADLKKLKELWLTGTPITDAGLVHLEGLKSLETLEVTGTRITPGGMRQRQQKLPSLNGP